MRVIAYTYCADVHCIDCTKVRFALPEPVGPFERDSYRRRVGWGWIDENGIPDVATDNDGNPVHPVFSTDEHDFTHCGTCHQPL